MATNTQYKSVHTGLEIDQSEDTLNIICDRTVDGTGRVVGATVKGETVSGEIKVATKARDYVSGGRIQQELEQKATATKTTVDMSATNITYTLEDNTDKTFTANNIASLNIIFPQSIAHGFTAGVNFKSNSPPPTVSFSNLSPYPLKKSLPIQGEDVYSPLANKSVVMAIFCDGMNVYCIVKEF